MSEQGDRKIKVHIERVSWDDLVGLCVSVPTKDGETTEFAVAGNDAGGVWLVKTEVLADSETAEDAEAEYWPYAELAGTKVSTLAANWSVL